MWNNVQQSFRSCLQRNLHLVQIIPRGICKRISTGRCLICTCETAAVILPVKRHSWKSKDAESGACCLCEGKGIVACRGMKGAAVVTRSCAVVLEPCCWWRLSAIDHHVSEWNHDGIIKPRQWQSWQDRYPLSMLEMKRSNALMTGNNPTNKILLNNITMKNNTS